MSYINAFTTRLFGGPGDQAARTVSGANGQRLPESLVATTSRKMRGPQLYGGLWSYHVIVGAGSTPVGNLTFWYSDLVDPDPTSDADWVDSGIASINLATVANTFATASTFAEHIRAKATVTSGTISLLLYARSMWAAG